MKETTEQRLFRTGQQAATTLPLAGWMRRRFHFYVPPGHRTSAAVVMAAAALSTTSTCYRAAAFVPTFLAKNTYSNSRLQVARQQLRCGISTSISGCSRKIIPSKARDILDCASLASPDVMLLGHAGERRPSKLMMSTSSTATTDGAAEALTASIKAQGDEIRK